jgi:GGDEF domain-containing protein
VVLLDELALGQEESKSQAGVIAEKIRIALAEPYVLGFERDGAGTITLVHRCTASIGVTLFIHTEASQDDILMRADAVMYEAKAQGRNRVQFHAAKAEAASVG